MNKQQLLDHIREDFTQIINSITQAKISECEITKTYLYENIGSIILLQISEGSADLDCQSVMIQVQNLYPEGGHPALKNVPFVETLALPTGQRLIFDDCKIEDIDTIELYEDTIELLEETLVSIGKVLDYVETSPASIGGE